MFHYFNGLRGGRAENDLAQGGHRGHHVPGLRLLRKPKTPQGGTAL